MPSNTPFGIEAYRALWAETVASVLSQFTGATLTGEVGAPPAEAAREGRWVTFTVTGALAGEQAFQISSADALQLGQTFMAESLAPEAEFNADHLDSLSELIRQFAGAVSSQLKGILGSDCSFQFRDTEAPPSLENWQPACLRVSTSPALTMIAWSDQVLLDALAKKTAQPAEKETTAASFHPLRQKADGAQRRAGTQRGFRRGTRSPDPGPHRTDSWRPSDRARRGCRHRRKLRNQNF